MKSIFIVVVGLTKALHLKAVATSSRKFRFNMDKLSCLFQVSHFIWGGGDCLHLITSCLFVVKILAFVLVLNAGGNPLNPFLNRMDYKRPEKVLSNNQEAFDVGNSSRGQRATCPEDYSPCTCALTISGLKITCAGVSVEDIQDVFFRTQTLQLYLVLLTATVNRMSDCADRSQFRMPIRNE